MWTCQKCAAQNEELQVVCHECSRSKQGRIVLLADKPGGNRYYTVALAPGLVRYFSTGAVRAHGIEELITALRELSAQPEIQAPQAALSCDALFPAKAWEDRLRTHHELFVMLEKCQLPCCVYEAFHLEFSLQGPEFEECAKSWVKEAWAKPDLISSFVQSSEHSLVRSTLGTCVFLKTPFVSTRLHVLDEEQKKANEGRMAALRLEAQKRRAQEEERDKAVSAENLRKSKFGSFVYVMEDLRNGCVKIGRSMTPERRERTLQSEVPEVVLRLCIPAEDSHEKHLHARFAAKRVRGEWFSLAPEDLMWIAEFLRKNGDVQRATIDYQWFGAIAFRSGEESAAH